MRYHACNQQQCLPPTTQKFSLKPKETYYAIHTLWLTLLGFLGAGILLAFSPCVLPMLPILANLIQHQQKKPYFTLGSYLIALSIGYACLGLGIANAGVYLQAWLQSAWILIPLSLLLIHLALPSLQLPSLPFRLPSYQFPLPKHPILKPMVLGISTPLVLSPCTTPALTASLALVSQMHSVILGASALALLGLGSGLPLLALGLLPKANTSRWLNAIAPLLGLMTLIIAIWLLSRLIPLPFNGMYWGIASAILVTICLRLPLKFWLQLPLILGCLSITYLQYQPNSPLNSSQAMTDPQRNTLVYITANWCSRCQQIHHQIIENKRFTHSLGKTRFVTLDLSHFTQKHQQLLQRYQLLGPPAFLFFPAGKQTPSTILTPPLSLARLTKILSASAHTQLTGK